MVATLSMNCIYTIFGLAMEPGIKTRFGNGIYCSRPECMTQIEMNPELVRHAYSESLNRK